jgi:RNA polymerase sigma-70 factor (ECF subfamily)
MPSPPRPDAAARQVRFEAVYAANHAPILGYALRRTTRPEDAADVLAETFLTAWRRLDELPDGDGARLWLYGVARRVLANYYRGERRRSALADRLRDEVTYAYRPPELTGESAHLADALRRLSEQDRELLTLAAWEGLDYGQIAVVLGCSRNAVRIRLHRARGRLAAQLASQDTAEPASNREGDPASLGNPGGQAGRGEPGAPAGPGDFRRFTGTRRPGGPTDFAPVGARAFIQPDQSQRG